MKNLFLILFAIGISFAQDSIVISTFNYTFPELEYTQQLMTEAYKRLGLRLVIQNLPSERALQSANQGVTSGELYRSGGLDSIYRHLVCVPVPLTVVEFVAYGKDSNVQIHDWESLASYRVVYLRGMKTVEEQLPPNTRSSIVNTNEIGLEKVHIGWADVFVTGKSTFLGIDWQSRYPEIKQIGPPLDTNYSYHYLHESKAALAKPLADTLQMLLQKGYRAN